MRKYIKYLTEAKADDDYAKNYSSISREEFDIIAKMDPRTRLNGDEVDSIGQFGCKKLLLPHFIDNENERDYILSHASEIKDALNKFYSNIAGYPKFESFNTVEDFVNFINNPESNNVELKKEESPLDKIYNQYYSDIERETFEKIIALDPNTDIENGRIGEIAKNLLLRCYKAGETIFVIREYETKKACEFFYDSKNELSKEQQNLMNYKTVAEFLNIMLTGPESETIARMKRATAIDSRTGHPANQDFRLIASTRDYDIIEPLSWEASKVMTQGYHEHANASMGWCTGSLHTSSYFHNYRSNGPLIAFIHKVRHNGGPDKEYNWQINVSKRSYKVLYFYSGWDQAPFPGSGNFDNDDDRFTHLLLMHPDIFFAIKDKDPFDKMPSVRNAAAQIKAIESAEYEVNEDNYYEFLSNYSLMDLVTTLKVNIENIPAAMCTDAIKVEHIVLLDKVKTVGVAAFEGCGNLRSLILNDGLQVIESRAFANCGNLRGSIRLPDSVTDVKLQAFMNDPCTLKVNYYRTSKLTFDKNDETWVYSHVKGIKVQ